MSPPPPVAYHVGMFANEVPAEASIFDSAFELDATCHHEAAHAVADYLAGRRLVSVGVSSSVEYREDGTRWGTYGGEVRTAGRDRLMVDFNYRRLHLTLGVALAAGPAGERRFRHEAGTPMRMLGATEGDHRAIDTIAKALERRGRCRFAFRRLVWGCAQKLIARDDVWGAVEEVARDLYDAPSEEDDDTGEAWAYAEPREVYASCRRNGLRRGQLLSMLAPVQAA